MEGYTARDECMLNRLNCKSSENDTLEVRYDTECLPPVYGVLKDVLLHDNTVTIQEAAPFCKDYSVPRAACTTSTPSLLSQPSLGPSFDGAWVASQHAVTLGTVLASPTLLGAGMFVRMMYEDVTKEKIYRVDILQIEPEYKDFTDLDAPEAMMKGVISSVNPGTLTKDTPFWMLLHLEAQDLVFNVTSSTLARNFDVGNGGPLTQAALVPGASVVVQYVGNPYPYPNIIQATRLSVSTMTPFFSTAESCINLHENWCSEAGKCQAECLATASKCSLSTVYCNGGCKEIRECTNKVVDVWGTLISYEELMDGCPGSWVNTPTMCGNKRPVLLLSVTIDTKRFYITADTVVGSLTGWQLDPFTAVQAAFRSAVRVEVDPADPEYLYMFSIISADNIITACRDDPSGIFEEHGWTCDSFIVLGCDYDLHQFSNIFAMNTPLSSVCLGMCGKCGNSTKITDICDTKGLDECLDVIAKNGCPTSLDWHNIVVCRTYRFCEQVNIAISKVCEIATAPPHTPCSAERERATQDTVGAFIPECNKEGTEWLPKQCQHDECWCVDVATGVAKAGTHTTGQLQCGFDRNIPVQWCDESFNTKLCSNPRTCTAPLCAENECAFRTDSCCAYKCKEVVTKIDPNVLRESRDIIQSVLYRVLTVTLEAATPEDSRESLHYNLALKMNIAESRLVLKFDDTIVTVLVDLEESLLAKEVVKTSDQIAERVRKMQVEQDTKVKLAEDLFKTDKTISVKAGGRVLYSKIEDTDKYMVVGTRAARQLEYVAHFPNLGNISFLSDEVETLISVNLPNLTNSSVSWVVHTMLWEERPKDGCPPADDATYDPMGSGRSSYCVQSSTSRFQYCRVGDMVGKHGTLVAGSQQSFTDLTLPLNGWASVLNRVIVLGTEPAVCARIGEPLDEQLIAVFNGPYLQGKIVFSQTELSRNTQVYMDLRWKSPIPEAYYNIHVHTDDIGIDMTTRCDDAGQHFNPLHVEPNKCPVPRDLQSLLNCELGDLTGKYGTVRIPGMTLFTDPIMDTVGSVFAIVPGENMLSGKSLVVHALDGSRIDCANIQLVGAKDKPPVDTSLPNANEDDPVNTIILLVGVLLAVFIAAALIGYLARHYVNTCLKDRAKQEEPPEEQEKEIVIPVGRSANTEVCMMGQGVQHNQEYELEMSEIDGEHTEASEEVREVRQSVQDTRGSASTSLKRDPRASQSIDISQIDPNVKQD
eukprot:TRINITY_DN1688_c0_g1_i1.p1 TRINITY_DN1688_c0_g1~~TRINITY_DN1688_c0_g1_i1.p1  ORF type:complete len:1411 (+),score=404.62 TRINITY_DN1688_c0_g1_i1:592-4233(+)